MQWHIRFTCMHIARPIPVLPPVTITSFFSCSYVKHHGDECVVVLSMGSAQDMRNIIQHSKPKGVLATGATHHYYVCRCYMCDFDLQCSV